VGDGPDRDRLMALGDGTGILWRSHVRDRDHLADLVAAADLYLAPGPVETFGLSALEAMASGVPVLSVDSGGVPELVGASGCGALYHAGDAADFTARAIELVCSDLEPPGRAGRAYVEEHHPWNTVLPPLFDVYRQLLRP
jgi:alpha-1,6-mannosyltransferase